MSKLLVLTLNEQEENAIDKIIAAISDYSYFPHYNHVATLIL